MLILIIRFLLATLGASAILWIIRKYLRIGRRGFIDADGIIERIGIVICFSLAGNYLWAIPAIICIRVLYAVNVDLRGYLLESGEPAVDYRRAGIKTEILADLILSPTLAIIACIIL